jgi:hypothetical protein
MYVFKIIHPCICRYFSICDGNSFCENKFEDFSLRTVHSQDIGSSSMEDTCLDNESETLKSCVGWRHHPGPLWGSHMGGTSLPLWAPGSSTWGLCEPLLGVWHHAKPQCTGEAQALEESIIEFQDDFAMNSDRYRIARKLHSSHSWNSKLWLLKEVLYCLGIYKTQVSHLHPQC